MNRSQEEERSRFVPVVRVAVVLLLLLLVTAGVQSWRDLSEARELRSSLESEIAETQESIVILRDRLERIESDPATLERLAREELGWVREGDVVVVLPREEAGEGQGERTGDDGERAPATVSSSDRVTPP